MRPLVLVLPFLFTLSLFASAPVVTMEGFNADVAVDAGHRVAWIRYVRATSGGTFDTGFATSDASGRVRIEYASTPRDLTLIVADVETGQFTPAAAGSTSMIEWTMRAGTILPTTSGAYTQLAVSDITVSENPFAFGALWVRPGVGAWAAPTKRVVPDLWGHFGFYLYDARQMVTIGPPAATPSGFAHGDRLLLLKNYVWQGGLVDAQLDAPPNPGVISMLYGSTEVWREGQSPASLWIIRTVGTAGTVSVRCCALSGDAIAGRDYAPFEPREVVFGPGEVAKRIDFTLLQNSVYSQTPRTLIATLENVSGGAHLGAWNHSSVQITDDDQGAAPQPGFGDVPATVLEGDAPWTLNVPVTLTGDFQGTFQIEFFAGTTERLVDFAQGEKQKLVPVTIAGDTTPSADRTLTLAVASNGARVERTITIVDDDTIPPVTIATTRIEEGDTERVESIRLVLGSAVPFPVRLSVAASANGSAQSGIDFSLPATAVQFAPGVTEALVPVVIKGDSIDENDETIEIVVTMNGQTIRAATITLADDDSAVPKPRITIDDVAVKEKNDWTEAAFTVRLSRASSEQVRVAWGAGGGTASAPDDYERASGVITFAPGQTTRTIVVRIAGDRTAEVEEWFAVDLSGAEGASVDDARGVCTIEDDDASVPGRRRSTRS